MNIHHLLRNLLPLLILYIGLLLGLSGPPVVEAVPMIEVSNSGWMEMGGSATGGGISDSDFDSIEPAIAAFNDMAIVAWEEIWGYDYNRDIYVKRWDEGISKWVEYSYGSASGGGISNSSGNSEQAALIVDPDGLPIIAWVDDICEYSSDIFVRRWNGTAWVFMDSTGCGISNSGDSAARPSLANTRYGPVVVWEDLPYEYPYVDNYQIYVLRWNEDKSEWEELGSGSASGGGISNSNGDALTPSIAVDADGNPMVAWTDSNYCEYYDCDREIYLKRYNGSSWEEFSSGSASNGGISNNTSDSFRPSLAADSDGNPIVAWENYSSGTYQIFAKRWDENNRIWVEMDGSATGGGISDGNDYSKWPSLAIHPDGSPVAAWQYGSPYGIEIDLKRWNGSSWVEMDTGSASDGGISNDYSYCAHVPSLAITSKGTAVVAWESGPYCKESPESQPDSIYEFDIYALRYVSCYALTLKHTGEGSDPVPSPANSPDCPDGSYTIGQKITLTAMPAAGWRVAGWDGTDNDASTAESNSLTMPASDHTVSVEYVPSCYALTRQHTGQGSDPVPLPTNSPDCPPGSYSAGEQITLAAMPAAGWQVAGWDGTDNDVSTAESNSFTMPASDHTVSVEYVRSCFALTSQHTGQGSDPVPSPANSSDCPPGSYNAGEQITLTAIPASGSQVAGWAGTDNDASTAKANMLIMPASDHTVSVEYASIIGFLPLINFDCSRAPEELEPNNNYGRANGPLCEGTITMLGWPNDTFDYFKFDTKQVGTVSVMITNHHDGGAQLGLDYKQEDVVNPVRVVTDTSATDGLQIEYQQAKTGRYYVTIYTETPNSNETRPYTMQVTIP